MLWLQINEEEEFLFIFPCLSSATECPHISQHNDSEVSDSRKQDPYLLNFHNIYRCALGSAQAFPKFSVSINPLLHKKCP